MQLNSYFNSKFESHQSCILFFQLINIIVLYYRLYILVMKTWFRCNWYIPLMYFQWHVVHWWIYSRCSNVKSDASWSDIKFDAKVVNEREDKLFQKRLKYLLRIYNVSCQGCIAFFFFLVKESLIYIYILGFCSVVCGSNCIIRSWLT